MIQSKTGAELFGHTFQDVKKLCPDSEAISGMDVEFAEKTLKTSAKAIECWIETI